MIAEIARFARKVLIRVIISRMKYYKQVLAIESLRRGFLGESVERRILSGTSDTVIEDVAA